MTSKARLPRVPIPAIYMTKILCFLQTKDQLFSSFVKWGNSGIFLIGLI